MKKILSVVLIVLLSACASQQHQTNELAQQLYYQTPQQILSQLQNIEPPQRDIVQYNLNLGLLHLLSVDFPGAIAILTQAKQQMLALEATSVSENLGAGTVNETLRSYSGYPTDRVMVHNILALSYLFNDDIEGARVEMLQAEIAMKKLQTEDSLSGQLASTHLLSAIIYEMLDEQSNALISYSKTEKILIERHLNVPRGLKSALLRMSYKLDKNGQYRDYQQRYSDLPIPANIQNKQVFSLYFDGIVSHKQEASVTVPSFDGQQLIRISMPSYAPNRFQHSYAQLADASQQVTSQLVENLETLVREDLDKEYPSILLLTTTRAVAKYKLVEQTGQQDNVLGALVNLATILSEVADLRSWNMLPSNIQFSYLETSANSVMANIANLRQIEVKLQPKSKNLLLMSNLQTPIFHYVHKSSD